MHSHQISKIKATLMRRRFIEGNYIAHRIAKEFKITRKTAERYLDEFKLIQSDHPERLLDMDFYAPQAPWTHHPSARKLELQRLFPVLTADEKPGTEIKFLWKKYLEQVSDGYVYVAFKKHFYDWLVLHPEYKKPALPLYRINEKDLSVIKKWRRCNDRRLWQIAVSLDMASKGIAVITINKKIESRNVQIRKWLETYRLRGLAGFDMRKRELNFRIVNRMQTRKDNLIKLLHETPKLHGLNRTSWTITALTQVYRKVYEDQASYMQLSRCLKQLGYGFKKSRDMLTSQDPKFREKIKKIQQILRKLKPDEKFFSVDEYGPVSVKIKGGVTLKQRGEAPDIVPEKQKVKGVIICTAALELSTNQVTHFYSLKKNTFEMIKLVDILIAQYHDQRRLYLCWDAVSFHNSKILKNHIEDHNKKGTPEIRLAPLPSASQFLNVIESVFGGLARAVIHNSDYPDVVTCKKAIDLHFQERNQHFLESPKRAGNKIWGKEPVVPRFRETQNCRSRSAMRGAK